ncbi:dNA polymerase IV [Firmicutes bacterium CAG:822]|nr:dNA polymerase IV [Firmicutes bacterium CAG:822]
MKRIIMHIDVNNAFLSWTAVLYLKQGMKIDIRKTYAVIGGDEKARHGIVLAKSMPAKKRGVITAETLYSAKKKCPNLKVYPPNYNFYKKMSDSMLRLIGKYSPDIEQMSIDECFLDYTPVKHLYGDEVEFAYRLKKEILDSLGFTVNIGIGNNKLCAKMASDFSKPYKVHTLFDNEVEEKMWPLQVDELFGIGKKTAIKLHNLNINTIYDLAHIDSSFLYRYFKNQAKDMIDSANGKGSDIVVSEESIPKGIGNETTLSRNISSREELYPYLLALSENVAIRLRKQKKYASVIVVTLKDKFFKRMSHQKKLVNATNLTEEIYKTACDILDEMNTSDGIRLIGVRLDKLSDTSSHQVSLFEDLKVREDNNELEKTVDELKEKYGFKVIKKASLIDNKVGNKYLNK